METSRNPSDDVDIANSGIALETEYEIGSVEYKAVAEIDNALRRIESGKYGVCEDCGQRIPEARLKALPFAYLCVKCKEREEREGEAADPFAVNWDALTEFSGGDEDPGGDVEHAVYRGTTSYPA
jgi:RNA polymerase-binding protein DksA